MDGDGDGGEMGELGLRVSSLGICAYVLNLMA